MIGSSFFRGGLRITSWSTGSTPSNWLGRPVGGISVEFHVSANNRLKVGLVRERSLSIKMLMQRIHIALSGLLSPNIVLSVMTVSAAAAVLSWKDRKFFWMLWNINFPATPFRNNGAERRRIRRTLFDGRQDDAKVVVYEDHVRGFLRDVRPTLAHRYPNIRHFKRQRVVNCSTSTQHAHQNHKTNKQKR